MSGDYGKWFNNFMEYINSKSYEEAVEHFKIGFEIVFSSSNIYEVYCLASKIPKQYYKSSFSKLLLGWLCFACGDNKMVEWVLLNVNENELKEPEYRSTFYALKSMTTAMYSKEESLRYGERAIEVLQKENWSFIAGNAYMTYGRQLTNNKLYRKGARYFEKAYNIFRKLEGNFLSINCFVSNCLNLYALGECREVINKCNEALMFNTSKNSQADDYISIIKLPMGMSYYELNKISLAIEALNDAKSAIVNLKLVHMHGILEQYLFECYRIADDKNSMEKIIAELESIFANVHYPEANNLIASLKIKMAFYKGEDPKKEWVEKLELAYQLEKEGTPTFLYEILTELKLRGYSKLMSSDILLNKLTGLQFEGHVPEIQSISLYLAEFFYNKHKNSTSKVHLKNACEIYDEYNISAKFFNGSLRCYIYLSDINSSIESKMRSSGLLHDNVNASEIKENLTNRELEILQLIGQGKSNKEIAETLFISIGTTKWHINHIYSKLSVKKRFNAIEKAKRLNLIY